MKVRASPQHFAPAISLGATVPRIRIPLIVPLVAAVATFAAGGAARAQAPADSLDVKSAAHIRGQYLDDMDSVHVKILALANAIPANKYSWRPAAGVRSVSEVLMHVAGEWYFFAPMSVGLTAPPDFLKPNQKPNERLAELEKTTSKPAVLAELNKSWAYCKDQLGKADVSTMTGKYKPWGVTIMQAALGMTGDQHEHLGQLIAYSRSVGVKPPWSK
jgi:uncharacterized damage-inducible protein DinB